MAYRVRKIAEQFEDLIKPKPIEPSAQRILRDPGYSGPALPKWTRNGRWSECGTWLVNNRGEIIYP